MATQSATWIATARLVRRTGFGATGTAVDAAVRQGLAAYVASALAADPTADLGAIATPPPSFAPVPPRDKTMAKAELQARNRQIGADLQTLTAWWIRRMVAVHQPFGEKLTVGWHDHFATAATKVRNAGWLLAQNATLRRAGRGNFRTMAMGMLTDAAMLRWLDGERNTAAAPNENLAREFMELFALGRADGYTETDVREGARALTGWQIAPDGTTRLNPRRHDAGIKTFLGVTGPLDAAGYCDAVLARPDAPAFLATRWWGRFASDTPPSAATIAALVTAYGAGRDLSAMFRALFTLPAFRAAEGTLVIDPLDWLIGAVRTLRVPVPDDRTALKLAGVLRVLGQVPFYPPNVSGWPRGQAWLTTLAADTRMRAALSLAAAADLSVVTDAATSTRLDAVGYLLGVGAWSERSATVLRPEITNPARLVAVALNTPEYLIH